MLYTVRYWLPDADYDSMPFIFLQKKNGCALKEFSQVRVNLACFYVLIPLPRHKDFNDSGL